MTFTQDVENFIDRYFDEEMLRLNIPGAVFVLVKGDELLVAKGYGLANIEQELEIIPDQTVFRVGSISKLFTATAVMQLVESGKLDLFEDINHYLKDFQITSKYSQPIVAAHLLTHTGGFDEHSIGLETLNPSELIPLGQYLSTRMPLQVMPPGQTISYSNHGMGLAGYLVESISGIPFEQYIQTNIFQPLEMHRSSFQLPSDLAQNLAIGYEGNSGSYQSVPFSYIKIPPGGSLNTTATDIGHFMMAHLQNGCYQDRRILSEKTSIEMHRQQFTNHPKLPGFAYGFYESLENNCRAIMHGGTVRGFTSLLFLLPEQNIGFFVAGNSLEFELGSELMHQFLDQFYPRSSSPIIPLASTNFDRHAQNFTGYYRNNRYARNTLQKISSLFSQIRVSASENSLIVPDPSADEKMFQWIEVEPQLFQEVDHDSYLAFGVDERGSVTHLFRDISGFEKLHWYETRPFHLISLGAFILFFLVNCGIHGFLPQQKVVDLSQVPELLSVAISVLNLTFVIGFILASARPNELIYGVSHLLVILLCLPLFATILTIGLTIVTLLNLTNGDWTLWQHLYYLLMILVSMSFSLWLHYWNLLGFRFC